MVHLGIDFGTTNTLAAYVDNNGVPTVLAFDNGASYYIPSRICIEDYTGKVLIGEKAKEKWATTDYDLSRCYQQWNLHIGEGQPCGKFYTQKFPEVLRSNSAKMITPEILTQKMVEYLLQQCNEKGQTVNSIMFTMPERWRREEPDKYKAICKAAEKVLIGNVSVIVKKTVISDPIAAVVFWVWDNKQQKRSSLVNKNILVCNVDGCMFELSMICVGENEELFDVVKNINNKYAGDYVDALICADICRKFNHQYNTTYSEDADKILDELKENDKAWLRKWIIHIQKMKDTLMVHLKNHKRDDIFSSDEEFKDENGNCLTFPFNPDTCDEILKPFYISGCQLLNNFLINSDKQPDAVVYCGCGSQIFGIQEKIISPVLNELYGEKNASGIMNRIAVGDFKTDHSIVLGAALIANGTVTIKERLPADIGLRIKLPALIAGKLVNSEKDEYVYLMPILAKGTPLPAIYKSNDVSDFIWKIKPATTISLEIIIDDGSNNPRIENWEIKHPGGETSCNWIFEVDADGLFTVKVDTVGSNSQEKVSTPVVAITSTSKSACDTKLPMISIDKLLNAIREIKKISESKVKNGEIHA